MTPLKILFWNIKDNNLSLIYKELLKESADIMLFCEGTPFNQTALKAIREQYELIQPIEECNIHVFVKKGIKVLQVQSKKRYILIRCVTKGLSFNLVGLHLQSQLYTQQIAHRQQTILNLKNMISSYEAASDEKTVLIGDFNINPYDQEMTSYIFFNAVSFMDLMENDLVRHQGEIYKKFYNPMLELISEEQKNYGSYFYPDEGMCWHFFDQCLLRKEILPFFKGVKLIKKLGNIHLISNKVPNKKISDHLPIVLHLGGKNHDESI